MMGYDHIMWGYGGVFMLLFSVLLIAGLVLLIRWLVQQGKPSTSHQADSPIDILKKRYARGEIDRNEFENKRKVLLSQ